MKYKFLLFFGLLLSISLSAQISHGGQPYSFQHGGIKTNVDFKVMPAIDLDQLQAEDAIDDNDPDIPWRFGKDMAVDFNMDNSGTWETLANGDRIWRLEIVSYGAYAINLIFNEYKIPQGGSLFIYNVDHTHVIGSFTHANEKPNGGFATIPVRGERSILEYYEPKEFKGAGRLAISYVIHDYRDFYASLNKGYGSSGSCNVNVNCPEGDEWQDQKRGAAMVLTGNNARKCSGSMVNNTANDGTPYFLTANHCMGGENSWIIMFNYESLGCDNEDGPTNQSVQYTTLRAHNSASDFCLVELSEIPPLDYHVFYNGWSKVDEPSIQSVCIHHPKGDIKKITFDYDTTISDRYLGTQGTEGSHWRIVQWDLGTTEPGSSGSPLFNSDKRIIGQLHGGYASCTSLTSDWFGKFAMSWDYGSQASNRLKDWLDPLNLDLDYIDGYDPQTNQYTLNAAMLLVLEPQNSYGSPVDVAPVFIARNMGTQTLTSLNISYQLNEGDIQSIHWTGSLNTFDTIHINFPQISLDYGTYDMLVYTDTPNMGEDEFPENDTIRESISVMYNYDIAIDELIAPEGVDCSKDSLKTKFIVKNNGFHTIDTINAHMAIDDEDAVDYQLYGPIKSGYTKYYILDTVTSDGDWHTMNLSVDIEGQEDMQPNDNQVETTYNSFGNTITLRLVTDGHAEETSWEITDGDGAVIESGGDYENNMSYKFGTCLASGCYNFTIYDTGGDGIQNSDGFLLINASSHETLLSGTDFGESSSVNFCIGDALGSDFSVQTDSTCTNRDVAFINESNAADYYSWYFEGGNPIASNDENPVVQYANAGVYDVSLKAWQGDVYVETLKEDFITVLDCSGTVEVESRLFKIFPNPSSGTFAIEFGDDVNFEMMTIYNQLGRKVFEGPLNATRQYEIALSNGLYMLELQKDNKTERQMLLITK